MVSAISKDRGNASDEPETPPGLEKATGPARTAVFPDAVTSAGPTAAIGSSSPLSRCSNCLALNKPRIVVDETAYAVTAGLQVGVYTDWYVFRERSYFI